MNENKAIEEKIPIVEIYWLPEENGNELAGFGIFNYLFIKYMKFPLR